MRVLGELLGDLGVACERIGLELDFLPAGDYARLTEHLPVARFIGVEQQVGRMRQVKDEAEVALLRRLSGISEQAIADAFAAVGPGSTELELASALTTSVYSQGAEQFKLMIVATGERSQLPNVGPTDRVLKPGDVCRVEIFSVLEGYQAGVCRTAAISDAPAGASQIWATLVECKHLLLDTIAPGVSTGHVWNLFKANFDRLRLPAISFVGHGIGVHLHEDPYIGPFSDVPLESGMVLGIEPLVYNTGLGFGMQLKDMIAVTGQGCELLSGRYDTDELTIVD
jgi:Xaa-Pro aminopeptidase